MIRGVTMIMMCRVSRPMPTFLNSRFRYGILLRTGGPNSLRPSRQRLQPAQQHRAAVRARPPSSGCSASVNAGCCRNCVNGIGWPWLPPSNTGVTNVVNGNSGTVAPDWAASVTGRFSRTNRRSAETTRLDRRWSAPPVSGRRSCPGRGTGCCSG